MKRNTKKTETPKKTLTLADLEIDAKLTRQLAGGECNKNKTEVTT